MTNYCSDLDSYNDKKPADGKLTIYLRSVQSEYSTTIAEDQNILTASVLRYCSRISRPLNFHVTENL